jgi:putative DNA primase/helicase
MPRAAVAKIIAAVGQHRHLTRRKVGWYSAHESSGINCGIRPKCHDDWTVVPNLWGMAIGRPGIMKTPALQEPLRPLKRLEVEAQKEHERAAREFAARALVADAAEDVAKSKLRAEIKKGANLEQLAAELADREEAEPEPVRHRFIINDSTVEKLGEILNQNPNGVLCYRDELIGLLKSLDKEGQEGARAFYLEAWNGTGRYTYDRIGRGTIDIEVACISVLGATQPGPLGDYQRDAVRSGAGDDGLLQRFQVAVWPDVSKEWVNCDRWPNSAAREAAYDVFSRLAALDPVTVGADTDEHDPGGIPYLRFDEAAQERFDAWRASLERRVRSGEEHPAIESHLAKYRSLIPSLALLFHLADGRRGALSAEALERAIAWGEYLESHARRIFSPTVRSAVGAAHALTGKIMAGALPSGFGLKDVYHAGWSKLSSRQDVEEAAELLIEHNWLRETTDKQTGGRPRSRFWINPKLGAPVCRAAAESPSGGTAKTAERGGEATSGGFGGSAGGPFQDYEPDERAALGEGGM